MCFVFIGTSFYLLNFPLRTTTSTRRKRAFQIPRNCAPYGAGLSIWYLKAVVGLVAENGKPAPFFVSVRERLRVAEDREHTLFIIKSK